MNTCESFIIIKGKDFRIIQFEISTGLNTKNNWEISIVLTRIYSNTDVSQLLGNIFEKFFSSIGIKKGKTICMISRLYHSHTLLIKNEKIDIQQITKLLVEKMKMSIEQILSTKETITFIDPANDQMFTVRDLNFESQEINCHLELFPQPARCSCGYGTVSGQLFLYWFWRGQLKESASLQLQNCTAIICPKCHRTINILPVEGSVLSKTG